MENKRNNDCIEEETLMERALGKRTATLQQKLITKIKSGFELKGIEILGLIEFSIVVNEHLKLYYSLQRNEKGEYFYVSNNGIYTIPKLKLDTYENLIKELKNKYKIR
ncbi:MAG: hypothetical protein QW727_02805 [Candidatus Pacearchaeota archaeon]